MALAVLGYAIIGRSKPSGLIILVPGAIVMLTGLLLLVLSHHVAKEAHLIVVEQVTAVVVGFCAVVAGCLVLSEHRRLRRPGIGTSLKR